MEPAGRRADRHCARRLDGSHRVGSRWGGAPWGGRPSILCTATQSIVHVVHQLSTQAPFFSGPRKRLSSAIVPPGGKSVEFDRYTFPTYRLAERSRNRRRSHNLRANLSLGSPLDSEFPNLATRAPLAPVSFDLPTLESGYPLHWHPKYPPRCPPIVHLGCCFVRTPEKAKFRDRSAGRKIGGKCNGN